MAATTWSAGAPGVWSAAGNWSAGVPGAADDATFDNTSVQNATVDVSPSINSLTITAGYTGNWTLAGQTMTLAAGSSIDGTGVYNLGNGWTANGLASTVHFGAGMGVTTATSTVLTMNGTTGMTLDIDKSVAFMNLTLGANAVVTNSSSAQFSAYSNAIALNLGNNSTFTNNITIIFRRATDGDLYAIGTGVTINGTGVIYLYSYNSNVTYPAFTYTGSGVIYLRDYAGSGNSSGTLTGNISTTGTLFIIRYSATNTTTFNQAGFSITAGTFNYGCSNATGTFTGNFDGALDIGGAVNGTLYNLGTININLGTSTWNVAGNYTALSVATYTVGTSAVTIDATSTITSNGKTWAYDLTFTPGAANTVTMADALTTAAAGDLAITNGTLATGGFAVTVGGAFACNGTSTYSGNAAALTVAGNFTIAAGATWTINAAATLVFSGTANVQQVTLNAKVMAATTHNGAGGTVQLQDAFSCGTAALTLTAGAWDSNGQTIACGAFTWNSNDAGTTLDGPIATTGNLVRGAAAAGLQTSTITMQTNSASITSNGGQWGPINCNPGALNTVTLIDAFSTYGNFTVTTGGFTTANFAVTCGANILFNGIGILNFGTTTVTSTGNAAITFNAGPTYTTANSIWIVQGNTTISFGINVAVSRLQTNTPGQTITWLTGAFALTIGLYVAGDIGSAGVDVVYVSAVPGVQYNINWPVGGIVVANMAPTDNDASGGGQVDATDGTSVDGGNNLNWLWPAVPTGQSNGVLHGSHMGITRMGIGIC